MPGGRGRVRLPGSGEATRRAVAGLRRPATARWAAALAHGPAGDRRAALWDDGVRLAAGRAR